MSFLGSSVLEGERFLLPMRLCLKLTTPALGREAVNSLGGRERSDENTRPRPLRRTRTQLIRERPSAQSHDTHHHPASELWPSFAFSSRGLLKCWALLSHEMTLQSVHVRFLFVLANPADHCLRDDTVPYGLFRLVTSFIEAFHYIFAQFSFFFLLIKIKKKLH